MTPEKALALQQRVNKEIMGLRSVLDQFDNPEAASTPAGLKSAIGILARSLLRTNQIAYDIVRETVAPPEHNPFADWFGRR